MRFVSVRELRNRPGRIWASLSRADVVLTSNGKPVGVLVGVDEARLNETVDTIRRAKVAMAVSRVRKRAAEAGTSPLTMADLNREVLEVRRKGRPA